MASQHRGLFPLTDTYTIDASLDNDPMAVIIEEQNVGELAFNFLLIIKSEDE